MAPSDPQQARRYATIRYRLVLADLAVSMSSLVLLQWSGASHAVAGWWSSHVAVEPARILGYLAICGTLFYLITLPLSFYGGFLLEHRFGLSRLTRRGWLIREGKRLLLSAVIGALLVEGLYALLRLTPSRWPIFATLGWVGFTIVMARIFPTVLLPLFYKTTPLEDEALTRRLLDLCHRTGLAALGVFRFQLGAETRKVNAALAGLGGTRRVLLSDTLLEECSPEEIEGVLAHELAHHRYRHLVKMLVISAVGSWAAFALTQALGQGWVRALGLESLADIAGFPALMLWFSFLGFVSLPLQNGISRHFEWQADRFAVETTQQARAFAEALRRLAALNLADPEPPAWVVWLFYDHPPITQRIQAAEAASVSTPRSCV